MSSVDLTVEGKGAAVNLNSRLGDRDTTFSVRSVEAVESVTALIHSELERWPFERDPGRNALLRSSLRRAEALREALDVLKEKEEAA